MTMKKLVAMVAVLSILMFTGLMLAGCGKLSRDNFDRVKVGMDYSEVVSILGQPDKCDAAMGTKNCVWGNDTKNITVKFIADKVAIPTMKGL